VNLEEELQKFPIADTRRVELNLDSLSVRSMVAIGGVRHIAAGVSDTCVDDAGQLPNQVLHAPEATAGEHSAFKSACHEKCSLSTRGRSRVENIRTHECFPDLITPYDQSVVKRTMVCLYLLIMAVEPGVA